MEPVSKTKKIMFLLCFIILIIGLFTLSNDDKIFILPTFLLCLRLGIEVLSEYLYN